MAVITGLSGNELYCLATKGLTAGNMLVGNSVHSMGLLGSLGSGIKTIIGGEITQISQLIEEGRETAFKRMYNEALAVNAAGITGVTSQLIFQSGNIEFLSVGSAIHAKDKTPQKCFSTSADGQALYVQLDAGFRPANFVFGNIAYSIGLGRGALGILKTTTRGEIKEYSDIFNHTRHLALERIETQAKNQQANAVIGINTSILPFGGVYEMIMIGTASHCPDGLLDKTGLSMITSDMTNIEMWNMMAMGYAPLKLLLGTSVYSLGIIGSVSSLFKRLVRGEINELTRLIYDARENALDIIKREAESIGADDIVGIKTYVYQLGNGLIEFMAIGTAVKKVPHLSTVSDQLLPQAMILDQDTFYDSTNVTDIQINMNANRGPVSPKKNLTLMPFLFLLLFVFMFVFGHQR